MKKLCIFCCISFLTLLYSCANKVAPTGGAKDVTPPKLKKAIPGNLGTHFNSKTIELDFDEFVQLDDVENQLIISPLIFPKPQIKASKKSVLIVLPDSLHPNTTYTINFGKSIADVHEKNIFEGYQYVFSTGSFLDSLTCTGKVIDAATAQPLKGLTVMLYRDSAGILPDSAVFKRKPEYFTKTDEQGSFNIRNIATGSYALYALDDKNSNYICDDLKEEKMAFSSTAVVIPQNSSIYLFASRQESPSLKLLKSTKVDRLKALIVFSKSVPQVTIDDLKTQKAFSGKTDWTKNRDSLFLFLPDTLSDSINVRLTDGALIKDTVVMQMSSFNAAKIQAMPKLKCTVVHNPFTEGPSLPFSLQGDRPISAIDTNIQLMQDSVIVKNALFKKDSLSESIIHLNYKWKEGSIYKLMIPSGTIKDLYGLTTDTLKFTIAIPTPENTGILTVKVDSLKNGSSYLLQLTDDKFSVVRQQVINKGGSYTFSYLQPTIYRLRLIEDKNKNGRWDAASYGSGQQPEPVSSGLSTLQIRANWEMETTIFPPSY